LVLVRLCSLSRLIVDLPILKILCLLSSSVFQRCWFCLRHHLNLISAGLHLRYIHLMCGRYRLARNKYELMEHFGVTEEDLNWEPHYNIAPTQQVPIVRQDRTEPKRKVSLMRWGLIPFWAKDPSIGSRMINAMSESAAEKPAFREAISKRRCLVPADGFYEWQELSSKEKQPYNFGMADNCIFAFAGLWEKWKNPENQVIETCTILTTKPNAVTAEVHDRMPVILMPEDYDLWLDPGVTDPARVKDLLHPCEARLMRKFPVSTRVNSVKNDDAECAAEISRSKAATLLF
jgi:putative SOS response-associated peptidase YedK